MIPVPTLAEVVNDPDLVEHLPATVCGALLIEAGVVTSRLGARIALAPLPTVALMSEDRLLTIEGAAALLGIHPKTLYRRAKRPPFDACRVDVGVRALRFSSVRLREYLQTQSMPGSARRPRASRSDVSAITARPGTPVSRGGSRGARP